MIRRQVSNEYWLITQHDHAQISGKLAKDVGNKQFPAPSCAAAILGIGLHDCGWPIHDDCPTLNPKCEPLDVFETPRQIALGVWEASAQRATEQDDYAGLLVSLHGLSLSVFATSQATAANHQWNLADHRTRFEVNRFQHACIEMQESLRRRLGLRVDQPLKHGLVENSDDPRELQLKADFHLLLTMDQISLGLCCTQPPFPKTTPLGIGLTRPSPQELLLNPWPFKPIMISVEVPFRRLPAKAWADETEFRAAYAAASVERFTVTLRPRTI